MSFFDDISMGLGLKKKDDAYRERTAETISRNQGNEAADRYRESQVLVVPQEKQGYLWESGTI